MNISLLLLAYLGGALTIASPCILPVLPFVFARSDRPFISSGLPLLGAMAVTFAVVATLASVVGGWAVAANQYGRVAALSLLVLFGLTLLFPSLSDRLTKPLVALGARLSTSADAELAAGKSGVLGSLALGVATGLLWAPCAGPILGLILTGAALRGASTATSLLLIAYAAGSATSLALALLVGGKVFAAMKRSLGASEWLRRGLGAAVLVAVAAIALGFDTGVLTKLSIANTAAAEQKLLDAFHGSGAGNRSLPAAEQNVSGGMSADATGSPSASGQLKVSSSTALPIEGVLPSLAGATAWLNSAPLTAEALRGKVVLIDFWTYSCINCLRAIPYVKAWADKYRAQGLVVIGVHAPEFAFEKDLGNVKNAVADLKINYPVAVDSNYSIWRAFNNQYWPAHYFVDAKGQIRHHHFGEGEYEESEQIIQQLLVESGHPQVGGGHISVSASGSEAAADLNEVASPETYVGYARAQNFSSPGGFIRDARHSYQSAIQRLNEWGLSGDWTVAAEQATLMAQPGSIAYRFHARDLHLVVGPSVPGTSIPFQITIDGSAPGANHGADVDASGNGVITQHRLYQLVRQSGRIDDRTFEIRFLAPGVNAYAFTFG